MASNPTPTPEGFMDFSGLDQLGLGEYFIKVFGNDEWTIWRLALGALVLFASGIVSLIYIFTTFFVPTPRKPRLSEKQFTTMDSTGDVTDPAPLPCWYDDMLRHHAKQKQAHPGEDVDFERDIAIEPAEILLSLVIPAFNEENRLSGMLEEAVNFLENEYGSKTSTLAEDSIAEHDTTDNDARRRKPHTTANGTGASKPRLRGWEILLIDDGSTDHTLLTAQTFARAHILPSNPRRDSGPWTHRSPKGVKIPPGSIRTISLEENRGKGGAVTHGMRHARGQYILFADADGASKFPDVAKLIAAAEGMQDSRGRAVAVGSRAHLVGSEAVVQRSKLRNFLMHSFHLLLWLLTPPATARIKDTQCGFKLFTRASLPYIIPHMHMEGWIFDVEMLMLAESAGIPVVEVPVGWREVGGSKLNVVRDSLGMAWGLAILRICWGTGIFRR